MTIFIAVVHVRLTVVAEIFSCAIHAVPEATPLDVAAHSLIHPHAGTHIAAARIRLAHLLVGPTHLLSLTDWLLRSAH